jgi:hypothetical protein
MALPGEKAKFINVMDSQMADDLQPLYSIEICLAKSPKEGVKCGAVVVFKLNQTKLDLNPEKYLPEMEAKMQESVQEETQVMFRDPEYFKETDGQWLPWAIDRALALFDRYGTNASMSVTCPELRIHQRLSRRSVMEGRSKPRSLFASAFNIDRLFDEGYTWDPWTKSIRRGKVGAEMAKR